MVHRILCALSAVAFGLALPARAQTMDPYYAGAYTLDDLGSVPGGHPNYGGLAFKPDDPSLMFIGGFANGAAGEIDTIRVARDSDAHISSFGCGTAEFYANAHDPAGGGIDGGLSFGPAGVIFFTMYPFNYMGELRPGDVDPFTVNLTPLGVAASVGALQFVPAGFPNAGHLKIASYNGGLWYDTTVSANGDGTYAVAPAGPGIFIGGGPEGIVFIAAGNPLFPSDSVLVTEYAFGDVVSYELDANSDPVPATRRVFVSGLGGAEGAAIDPATGDFFFSTFGGSNRVIRVRGFTSTASCVGDLDGSRTIDLVDLALLLSAYGVNTRGDLDGNCITDLLDLTLLLANYGNVCE